MYSTSEKAYIEGNNNQLVKTTGAAITKANRD